MKKNYLSVLLSRTGFDGTAPTDIKVILTLQNEYVIDWGNHPVGMMPGYGMSETVSKEYLDTHTLDDFKNDHSFLKMFLDEGNCPSSMEEIWKLMQENK